MPKKRHTRPRHPPPSPLEQFFSGLRDIVLDTVEDVVDNVEEALYRQQQGQGQVPPPKASPKAEKRSRTGRNTDTVPKPYPHHHYAILGVSPDARQEVIQAAYRALSRIYHPDVPKTGNKVKMQRINSAYEIVGDPKKRQEYDRSLR